MIAYNEESLKNDRVRQEARDAYNFGDISSGEREAISNVHPVDFYSPNSFISIGLFLLTAIIITFSIGLFLLAMRDNIGKELGGIFIFFSLLCYGILELFVQKKKHFHSGVDAALLWSSGGLLIAGLNILYQVGPQVNSLIMFVLAIYFILRFADPSMVLVAMCAFFMFLLFSFEKFLAHKFLLLPLISMASAVGFYSFAQNFIARPQYRNYRVCIRTISILALLFFYISGNYFVVRQFGREMFRIDTSAQGALPWGWLFWISTLLIPVIYIWGGIAKKDRELLRTGLLLVAVSIFTVRYYHTIMPVENMMLLAGVILLIGSYFLTRYLQVPRNGFTSQSTPDSEKDGMNIEGLVISETVGVAQPVPHTHFGGGSFGGGGSSGEF